MKNIAIIPARGGSKRISRKNIKQFFGEPIIGRTISKLISCALFEKIVVSTDDPEIAECSVKYGAEVPFLRSAHLADDKTPTAPVISDMLKHYQDFNFNNCCCVYACTPLLEPDDFVNSLNFFLEAKASFCYTVAEYPHPIQRALSVGEEGRLKFLQPKYELAPTQSLERLVHDCGQFYWGQVNSWLDGMKMHSHNAVGYEMPKWKAIDIDTEKDWEMAEIIFHSIQG